VLLFLAHATRGGGAEAATPVLLKLEEQTVLRVGQMAMLRVPKGGRYAWPPKSTQRAGTLREARRSKDALFYRATKAGPDVIVISPVTRQGECISCETLHYFVTVVPAPSRRR
jgi:hypothetical protein